MNNITVKQEGFKVKSENEDISAMNSPQQVLMYQAQMASQEASGSLETGLNGTSTYGENVDSASTSKEIPSIVAAQNGPPASPAPGMATSGGPRDVLHVGHQSVQMNDLDLYGVSPMRPDRPETRNNLKRTVGYEESDDDDNDDDEGGPVRSSQEKAKRQRRADQTSQVPQESTDIKIGHHTAEPLITIFAKSKNGIFGRASSHIYSRKTTTVFPGGRSWSDYVHKNGQVNLDDVTLDPDLFSDYADELQDMKIERKRELISEYLHSIPREEHQTINAEAPTLDPKVIIEGPSYEHHPPFIVGYHKDHPTVPVRVQLRQQSGSRSVALLFKLKDEEVKNSHLRLPKLSVRDTQVKFIPEFARSTIEETKAEILARFLVNHNEHQDEEVATTLNQHTPHRRRSRARGPNAHSGKATPGRPQIGLPTGTGDGIDECLVSLQNMGQHFLTMSFEYGQKLKMREAALVENESALAEKEALIKRREQTVEEEIATGVEAVSMRKEDLLQEQVEQLEQARAEDHARMQKQIEQLTAQLEEAREQYSSSNSAQIPAPHPDSRNPASSSPFLDLNGMMFSQAYTQIPDDNPNTGWYWQNHTDTIIHHEGPLQGKKFTRNQVLQPIDGITVPGRLKDTTLRCGGIEYLHYEEDGIAKLVQNSESVVHHEGRYYVCWNYLREVREPAFKF
ncbi:hypothetical protein BKA64DRAFT_720601 [Cadophora sp. MPI-SDFR-AT-0126]|nr:hypothetical protein BKA64DRAFT_720601 [Leotiomycetes sp. MPI-SDFR-AT-0126]